MTQPIHNDAVDTTTPKPSDQAHPQNDATGSQAVSEKLLGDLQGRFYSSGSNPGAVAQLVKDGVLPQGSSVMDLGAVQKHLGDDTKALAALKGQKPEDNTKAAKDLATEKGLQAEDGKKLDAAQAAVDKVQAPIDARNKQDKEVKEDFDTLSKATKTDSFSKDDLTELAGDAKQPPAVHDAAQRLLATFHSETVRNSKNQPHVNESDDYASNHWYDSTLKINKDSIAAETANHAQQNAQDQKTLAPLIVARNNAQAIKDSLDAPVAFDQKVLDTINTHNKDLAGEQTQTAARIKDEQAALTPDQSLDKASRVVKGGGYYQVAENLLGVSDKHGHTQMQEKELKELTHLLQAESKELNHGHLPKYLKQNDQLLNPENLQAVMDKLAAAGAPHAVPAQQRVEVPNPAAVPAPQPRPQDLPLPPARKGDPNELAGPDNPNPDPQADPPTEGIG